jgi:hypothetical protein
MLLAGRQQRQVVADARQIWTPSHHCSPSAHLALQLPSTPPLSFLDLTHKLPQPRLPLLPLQRRRRAPSPTA